MEELTRTDDLLDNMRNTRKRYKAVFCLLSFNLFFSLIVVTTIAILLGNIATFRSLFHTVYQINGLIPSLNKTINILGSLDKLTPFLNDTSKIIEAVMKLEPIAQDLIKCSPVINAFCHGS